MMSFGRIASFLKKSIKVIIIPANSSLDNSQMTSQGSSARSYQFSLLVSLGHAWLSLPRLIKVTTLRFFGTDFNMLLAIGVLLVAVTCSALSARFGKWTEFIMIAQSQTLVCKHTISVCSKMRVLFITMFCWLKSHQCWTLMTHARAYRLHVTAWHSALNLAVLETVLCGRRTLGTAIHVNVKVRMRYLILWLEKKFCSGLSFFIDSTDTCPFVDLNMYDIDSKFFTKRYGAHQS